MSADQCSSNKSEMISMSVCLHTVTCQRVCSCVCVTIVRDDPPGSEGGVQASQHPEHAEPAQMFPAFIHLQELGEVCVNYRDGAANSGGGITKTRQSSKKKCLIFPHKILLPCQPSSLRIYRIICFGICSLTC